MFCHHFGLLGHDLKHCASYFALTKNEGEVICKYGDWLKAMGGQNHSPPCRNSNREEVVREVQMGEVRTSQVSHRGKAADGGATVPNPREQDELHKEVNYGKQGTYLEVKYVTIEINGIEATDKEGVGFGVFDTKVMVPNSNAEDSV